MNAYHDFLKRRGRPRRCMTREHIAPTQTRQPDAPHMVAFNDPDCGGMFRFVGRVPPDGCYPDPSPQRITGWFTDPFGDHANDGTGLMWGVVYRLTHRDRAPRYIAGYQDGGTDYGPLMDLSRIFDDASDAACHADGMAEAAAELERGYQRAWQAGSQWAAAREERDASRARLCELFRERRAVTALKATAPHTVEAWRFRVRQHISNVRDAIERMASLERGDGAPGLEELSFYPCARLQEAFNDGAGL